MWKLFSQRPLKRTQRIFRIAYRASRDGNTCHYYKHVSASFGVCLLYIYISLSLSKLHYIPYYSSYTSLYHYICFNSRFWCGTPTYISISSIRSRLGAGFHDLPSSGLDCMPRADAQFSEKWPPSLGKSGKTRGKVHQWTGKKNLEFMICFLSWGSCHWASLPNITYVFIYIYIYLHTIYSYDPSSSNAPELRKQKRWPS